VILSSYDKLTESPAENSSELLPFSATIGSGELAVET
jgi:hypothetical protein